MDWLRSCYSSQWRLFRDDPTTLVRGRYYFSPPGTHFVAGPTLYGSRVWDGNGTADGTEPVGLFPPIMGEVRAAPHRWDSGAPPVELPSNVVAGSLDCLNAGDSIADAVGPADQTGGFPNACFLPAQPPNDDLEFGFSVWSCPTQLFWVDRITELSGGFFDDARFACLERFAGATVTVTPRSKLYPSLLVVSHPEYACLATSGTDTLGQALIQAIQLFSGPQDYGTFSTGQLWYDFASYLLSVLKNAGALDGRPVMLTGHSYGGASVLVLAARVSISNPKTELRYITYGSPKPGDTRLTELLRGRYDGLSLANDGDLIAALPPSAEVMEAMSRVAPWGIVAGWAQWTYPPENALLFRGQVQKNTYQRFSSSAVAAYLAGVIATGNLGTIDAHTAAEYGKRIRLRCSAFLPTNVGEVFGMISEQTTEAPIVTACCPAGTPRRLTFLFTAADPAVAWIVGTAGHIDYNDDTHDWTGLGTTIHGAVQVFFECLGTTWLSELFLLGSFFDFAPATCGEKTFTGFFSSSFGSGNVTYVISGGGPPPPTPQSTWSLNFTGSGKIAITGLDIGTTHTISFWTNKDDATEEILFSDDGGGYLPDIDATNIYYRVNSYGSSGEVSVAHGGAAGGWKHWAICRSGASVKFYKNGTQIGTTQTLADGSRGSNVVRMAARNNDTFFYTGKLDDVGFFAAELDAATIAGIAAGTINIDTLSPIGLWRIEEGSGSTTADTSGGARTGTISGGFTWSTDVPPALA